MGVFSRIVAFFVVLLLAAVPVAAANNPGAEEMAVTVEVDFGGRQAARTVTVDVLKGSSVLEVLQSVAAVETHPVAGNILVTAIDGIRAFRGETAWYYKIDGERADRLAGLNHIDRESRITWTYTRDICSWKVDGGGKP